MSEELKKIAEEIIKKTNKLYKIVCAKNNYHNKCKCSGYWLNFRNVSCFENRRTGLCLDCGGYVI